MIRSTVILLALSMVMTIATTLATVAAGLKPLVALAWIAQTPSVVLGTVLVASALLVSRRAHIARLT